jgi:hypothetical protein
VFIVKRLNQVNQLLKAVIFVFKKKKTYLFVCGGVLRTFKICSPEVHNTVLTAITRV